MVGLVGCGTNEALIEIKGDSAGTEKQEERWTSSDAPSLFATSLEFKFDALPLTGEAQTIPWAGNYWPTYDDNINFQWDGANDSAAVKYEKSFGVTGVEDAVSKAHGIDSRTTAKECKESSECNSALGETCGKRRGKDTGRCIPTWWGICHAWAPAAILLPEPKRPVTRNGVTFKVQDLKALATLVHNSTTSKFVSLRCNVGAGDDVVKLDEYGRPSNANAQCRDTNAGTWHVLSTNYLGIKRQAFVEDRTYDHQVWNQPVRGYRVTHKKPVTFAEANALIGATSVGGATTKKTGTVLKAAWSHQGSFPVVAGQKAKIVMSGTGDADLFVKFGAEPTDAAYDCRPYEGGSAEMCELTVPADVTAMFVSVNGYADTSNFELAITVGGEVPKAYVFNTDAVSFVYVESEVDYISESSAQTDGNLSANINQYTHVDRYSYVLELDKEGKIIGGEWTGSSKTNHPDFVWLPTGAGTTSVAGGKITYANIKSLIDESVTDPGTGGGGGSDKVVKETGTIAKGAFKVFGPFNVAAGSTLTADMTGTGDADLYGRKALAPTLSAYDCRPYKNGSVESCSVAGPGSVFIAINGYAATSNFELTIKFKDASGTPPPPPPPPATITHLDVSGEAALGEMKMFELAVPAGAKIQIATTSAKDVDLYVNFDTAPTTSAYMARGYTATGNETVTVTAPSNGKLFIAVHGYEAASFTLKTSSL